MMMVMPRYLSYLYLAVFNMMQLLCPSTLSYDWQLGSIPLVYTPLDTRNILSAILVILTSAILVYSKKVRAIKFSLKLVFLCSCFDIGPHSKPIKVLIWSRMALKSCVVRYFCLLQINLFANQGHLFCLYSQCVSSVVY